MGIRYIEHRRNAGKPFDFGVLERAAHGAQLSILHAAGMSEFAPIRPFARAIQVEQMGETRPLIYPKTGN